MSLSPETAALALREARACQATVRAFTDGDPTLDEEWGYAAQRVDREARRDAGERLVGVKLGLTSAAKQQRMGVDTPVFGFLTDAMVVAGRESMADALSRWGQPRIEPEIAFVTGREIAGPVARAAVPAYVQEVLVAAEVIDSRFADFHFRLADVVADNTSAAGVVLGEERHALSDIGELADLRCQVVVDDVAVHEATGAAVLGDPLQAIVLLSEHLARQGETLPAGSLVLAGALTDAVPLEAGRRYVLRVEGLGEIAV